MTVVDEHAMMVRWRVTVLSQPAALVVVYVGVSVLAVYSVPCQMKLSQAVTVVSPVVLELIVRYRVSFPLVYIPDVVYVVLFQV